MIKDLWINLAVKDVQRSRTFFTDLGFGINEQGSSEHSLSIWIGTKKTIVMLFDEQMFRGITQHAVTNTASSSEVMLSFDVETREEVDEIARRVEAAGGNVFGKPTEFQGWMYGCGFTDPDGHRWNALHMDLDKMNS